MKYIPIILGVLAIGWFVLYFIDRRLKLKEFQRKHDCKDAIPAGGWNEHFWGLFSCVCTKVAISTDLYASAKRELGVMKPDDDELKDWLVQQGLLKKNIGFIDVLVVPSLPHCSTVIIV